MSYEIGSRVGDYEILDILGAGGMGRVYKVRNTISDRVEAMKVLLPDLEGNPGLADRFMREIKVQASLDHPNIAALHTALRLENQLVMLMEYVEGTTLDKLMESGRVPIEKAADYIAQVLSALSYAHARGVIHRDLKPGNMMVTAGGLVKLMDFGIAKMAADRKLTQTGSTVGSLYYMSPEQIKGGLNVDPRSDLYSIGVSLYEVVTGARPFQGDSEYSIMAAHLQSIPLPPVQISPNLPPGLNEVIMQALEKDPAKRFQTADAFRNALLHVCRLKKGAAEPPTPATTAKKREPAAFPLPNPAAAQVQRAHRGLWIAFGALIAVAVILAAALQIPKFRRTVAETAPVQNPSANPAAAVEVPESAQAENGVESQAAPASESRIQQANGSIVQSSEIGKPRQETALPAAVQSVRSGSAPRTIEASSFQPRTESREPIQASQPSTAPAEDRKKLAELKEVRNQLNLLSIRAGTVKESLDNLRRQQTASGLGLRADMANSAQRMDQYLNLTESALGQRDPESAKKNLDLAEREVSRLESFLQQ